MYTQVTGQSGTLNQDLIAGTLYPTIDFQFLEAPLLTEGLIKVDTGEQSEWMAFTAIALVAGTTDIYRATILSRGIKKNATSPTDTDTTLEKDHSNMAACTFMTHSLAWNDKASTSGNNTFTGANIFTGTLSFTGTSTAGLRSEQLTTAQRNALTGVVVGTTIYNTDTDTEQTYNGTIWVDMPVGSTNSNASETVKGKVELATVAEQIAQTSENVLQSKYLLSSASTPQTLDSGKITTLDATGRIPSLFMPSGFSKFGGTGADGVASGAIVIAGNGYIVKNYLTVSSNTSFTFSGTNVFFHLKVLAQCDLTNATIDLKGKGGVGGTGGTTTLTITSNGTIGQRGTSGMTSFVANIGGNGGGGGTLGSGGAGGTVATSFGTVLADNFDLRNVMISQGAGGAGGGGGYCNSTVDNTTWVTGGAGGNGGGCILIEAAGDLIFSSTTIDTRGDDGNVGIVQDVGNTTAGGSGGGGGGGIIVTLYNGTLSGSPTTLMSGGIGGASTADTAAGFGGGGGSGGNNIVNSSTAGTIGLVGGGGTGGNGGAGSSLLLKNTVFS